MTIGRLLNNNLPIFLRVTLMKEYFKTIIKNKSMKKYDEVEVIKSRRTMGLVITREMIVSYHFIDHVIENDEIFFIVEDIDTLIRYKINTDKVVSITGMSIERFSLVE